MLMQKRCLFLLGPEGTHFLRPAEAPGNSFASERGNFYLWPCCSNRPPRPSFCRQNGPHTLADGALRQSKVSLTMATFSLAKGLPAGSEGSLPGGGSDKSCPSGWHAGSPLGLSVPVLHFSEMGGKSGKSTTHTQGLQKHLGGKG